MTHVRKDGDIPPSLALCGLVGVLGLLLYLSSPNLVLFWQNQLDRYVDDHSTFLAVVILSFSINAICAGSVAMQTIGVNQQGSRLAALTKDRPTKKQISWYSVGVSLTVGAIIYFLLAWIEQPGSEHLGSLPIPKNAAEAILAIFRASFGISSSVLFVMIARILAWTRIRPGFLKRLPVFPSLRNGIVLGSSGDEDPSAKSEWVTMFQRALNGNVMISGSIGTGKTQGTILTYLDQLLRNFAPRPSFLVLDPKGTFIPEALKIIKKYGLEEHVLHMKLGGNVSFNPIYCQTPLKDAQFRNMTQMIRAAAINFMGRSSDSFWETSAFNLMNFSMALCAGKEFGTSFSLTKLYDEMVLASNDPLAVSELLQTLSQDPKFDAEEQFNLARSSQYFLEFDQMEQKLRSGILATATTFLNQFQEYQACKIFCPTFEEATIKTMDDVVDQGKILLFDISSPGLARSMGTFIKLHYEESVLNRLKVKTRGKERSAIIIADEYQDVVSTGGGVTIGDDRFCAKSREANAIAIVATQSLTSLKNSIGKEDSAKELFQNFRTMISGQSTDLMTIHYFQELMGQEDRQRVSHSVSENAQRPSRNLISGGFDAKDANISESVSTSSQKEYLVTGKEFATLGSFETFARIYDGNRTYFTKLYLKPYFLEKKNVHHSKVIELLKASTACLLFSFSLLHTSLSFAFPNVCTVVKTAGFRSCLNFSIGACLCGYPPRPCAQFSYYVPQTFVEVFPNPKSSYFGDLPGAAIQLGTVGSRPYGAESDIDTQSFQAHTMTVPLAMIPFATLPCGIDQIDRTCFGSMSEHLGKQWEDGSGDALQPHFLAWSVSPKACLLKGAAASIGGEPGSVGLATPSCSFSMGMPKYPPSSHSACTGWGVFYPRYGSYNGASQTAGALMIASRMKSLGSEIFHTVPSTIDEEWQMITPQASSCFKEGQNVAALETFFNAREEKRLSTGKMSGYLFTVWNKVSCCRDLAEIPTAIAAIEAMNLTCQALGGL